MSESTPPNHERILLSASDINRAAAEGVLLQDDADRLVHWAYDQQFNGRLISEPRAPEFWRDVDDLSVRLVSRR
jgi:hypothetical protein